MYEIMVWPPAMTLFCGAAIMVVQYERVQRVDRFRALKLLICMLPISHWMSYCFYNLWLYGTLTLNISIAVEGWLPMRRAKKASLDIPVNGTEHFHGVILATCEISDHISKTGDTTAIMVEIVWTQDKMCFSELCLVYADGISENWMRGPINASPEALVQCIKDKTPYSTFEFIPCEEGTQRELFKILAECGFKETTSKKSKKKFGYTTPPKLNK